MREALWQLLSISRLPIFHGGVWRGENTVCACVCVYMYVYLCVSVCEAYRAAMGDHTIIQVEQSWVGPAGPRGLHEIRGAATASPSTVM